MDTVGKYVDEGYHGHTFEKYKKNISEELYEMEQKNIHQDKLIVNRLKKIYLD